MLSIGQTAVGQGSNQGSSTQGSDQGNSKQEGSGSHEPDGLDTGSNGTGGPAAHPSSDSPQGTQGRGDTATGTATDTTGSTGSTGNTSGSAMDTTSGSSSGSMSHSGVRHHRRGHRGHLPSHRQRGTSFVGLAGLAALSFKARPPQTPCLTTALDLGRRLRRAAVPAMWPWQATSPQLQTLRAGTGLRRDRLLPEDLGGEELRLRHQGPAVIARPAARRPRHATRRHDRGERRLRHRVRRRDRATPAQGQTRTARGEALARHHAAAAAASAKRRGALAVPRRRHGQTAAGFRLAAMRHRQTGTRVGLAASWHGDTTPRYGQDAPRERARRRPAAMKPRRVGPNPPVVRAYREAAWSMPPRGMLEPPEGNAKPPRVWLDPGGFGQTGTGTLRSRAKHKASSARSTIARRARDREGSKKPRASRRHRPRPRDDHGRHGARSHARLLRQPRSTPVDLATGPRPRCS